MILDILKLFGESAIKLKLRFTQLYNIHTKGILIFNYSELHQLNQRYNLNQPIFKCYDISVETINYRTYILKIDQQALLIESTNDRVKTGMVKLLQSIQHTISYNQHPTEAKNEPQSNWTTRYRVDINLVLLVPPQTKEFEKNYKEQYHQFKKAIKEYEKLHKIDSKEPLI